MKFSSILLVITAFAIFILGLIMIFSTTSAEVIDLELDKSPHQAFIKQLMYACGGLFLGFLIVKVGYRSLLYYSAPLLAVFTVLLLLTLIPGIGREVNGSRRWLNLAGISFQTSEFVKYLIPAYFIHHLLQFDRALFTLRDFLKLLGIVSVPMFFILVEPNNGTVAVIAMTLVALFFVARIRLSYWAWPLLAFVFVIGAFASQLDYVSARLKVYMHPELDLKGRGHQPYQAKIAAGSGRMWGKGPGNGLQKLSYLPEAQNDYIAAIFGEEFGFFGILSLITLYLALATLGVYIACRAPDLGGFYLAASATFLISLQAFLNLGVVSGLLPSTGLNLPLFSQGGSSLMANMAGLSLLLSVSEGGGKDNV